MLKNLKIYIAKVHVPTGRIRDNYYRVKVEEFENGEIISIGENFKSIQEDGSLDVNASSQMNSEGDFNAWIERVNLVYEYKFCHIQEESTYEIGWVHTNVGQEEGGLTEWKEINQPYRILYKNQPLPKDENDWNNGEFTN